MFRPGHRAKVFIWENFHPRYRFSKTEISVTGPVRPLIWTHRYFYKEKSGEARSRKPSQPGWPGSYEEAVNHVRKVRKRCSNSRFSEMPACVVRVFRLLWATVLFSLSQAMTRGEKKEAELKSYKDHCRLSSSRRPPSYSKGNNPYGEPVCRLKLSLNSLSAMYLMWSV